MEKKLVIPITLIMILFLVVIISPFEIKISEEGKFEIVIVDAEHLNSNREPILEIYTYVNETDGITYTIPEGEYIRVYFERNLTNENFIDIVIHNSQPAIIEIYEKDSEVMIGKFENVLEGFYITGLNHSGSQDVFDLKSVGGEIIYDYVHDGRAGPMSFTAGPINDGSKVAGQNITFTATVTDDAGGGGPYPWTLVICTEAATTVACDTSSVGTCTDGSVICQSSSTVNSGQPNTCTFNTTGQSGTNNYDAYACNDNGDDDTAAASNPYSYEVTTPPDNDPSYFTTIPEATSIDYLQGFGVDFEATDLVGFGTYTINWTNNFQINNSGWLKNTTQLGVGTYNINVTINDTSNNLNSTIYQVTVNQITPPLTIGITPSNTQDYGVSTTATGSGCPSELVCALNRNDTGTVTNGETVSLGAKQYNYTYSTSGNTNYTTGSASDILTVNKISPTTNMVLVGDSPIIVGTAGNFEGSETNSGDGGCAYQLFADGSLVDSPDTTVYPESTVNYAYNTTGCANYTSGQLTDSLVINPADTCTPPGSGNWAITCSDNCVWDSDLTVPANILISGSGTLSLNSIMNLTSINWQIYKSDGCTFSINNGGSIR